MLLYLLIALLVWPGIRTSRWVSIVWAAVWGTGAVAPYLARPARTAGLTLGAVTAFGIWLVGEGLGDFSTAR